MFDVQRPLLLILVAMALIAALVLLSRAAAGQALGDPAAGRRYAEAVCAECHGVGPDDRSSPRADVAPFRVIAATPGWTGIALMAWLQTPHREMPNLLIPPDDRANVVAYIRSLDRGRW